MAKFIPAFASVKVGVEKTDAAGRKTLEIVDVQRPMTVRDLMRHTSGLTYGFFGTGLVKQAYRDARIGAEGDISNAQFADAIASCRWPTSPAAPGTTATRPTCSAAWSRWSRARAWASS